MLYTGPDIETQVTLQISAQTSELEERLVRHRKRSAALQAILDKCPEHLFSTDADELAALH